MPQSLLQERKTHQRFFEGEFGKTRASSRPIALDPADTIEDHRAVVAMGPAMERQSYPQRGALGTGKQQSVAAEIVETDALGAYAGKEMPEATCRQELPGQQVMPLHARLVSRFTTAINSAKWKAAAVVERTSAKLA
jgi:hypothetical protein